MITHEVCAIDIINCFYTGDDSVNVMLNKYKDIYSRRGKFLYGRKGITPFPDLAGQVQNSFVSLYINQNTKVTSNISHETASETNVDYKVISRARASYSTHTLTKGTNANVNIS